MAVGYLQRNGLATSASERAICLTTAGLDALDGYRHGTVGPKDEGSCGPLEAVVSHRNALVRCIRTS